SGWGGFFDTWNITRQKWQWSLGHGQRVTVQDELPRRHPLRIPGQRYLIKNLKYLVAPLRSLWIERPHHGNELPGFILSVITLPVNLLFFHPVQIVAFAAHDLFGGLGRWIWTLMEKSRLGESTSGEALRMNRGACVVMMVLSAAGAGWIGYTHGILWAILAA